MVRVLKNVRHVANVVLVAAAALGGCSSKAEPTDTAVSIPGLIKFEKMYSAYDGTHDYKLTPSIPSADPASTDPDPVIASTVKWDIDKAFATQEPYADLPAGILVTTKKAGKTTVNATATTKSGRKIKDSAPLTITQASADLWTAGDTRYNNMVTVNFMSTIMRTASGDTGPCGLPVTFMVPKDASCANCHNSMNMFSVEHTPQQTAGYSDDDLIQIFTMGMKPMGGTFNSPFLKLIPDPMLQACIYGSFHTWDIADDVKQGIVFKLRSIEPAPQPTIDITRLGGMGGPPGGGMGGPPPAASGAAGGP
jgi:hypothetical protein